MIDEELKKEFDYVVFNSKHCGKFKVTKYINRKRIEVEFLATGYKTVTRLAEIRNGGIKDPLYPNVFGVGYFGIGPFTCKIHTGIKKNSHAYSVWSAMIERCYSQSELKRKSSKAYNDVTVCDEWHNFQNFAKWFYDNLPQYDNVNLDKDLKVIGNKEYSPLACSFVPPQINALFSGTRNVRDLPRGVYYSNTNKAYVAQIHRGEITGKGKSKQSYLGSFLEKEAAITAYREAKINHVREVAEKYKHMIDPAVYDNITNKTLAFI